MGPFYWRNMMTGWWYTHPSEKYEFVSWDDYSQHMESHNPFMFQSTNQIICLEKTCSKPPTKWWYNGFCWAPNFQPYPFGSIDLDGHCAKSLFSWCSTKNSFVDDHHFCQNCRNDPPSWGSHWNIAPNMTNRPLKQGFVWEIHFFHFLGLKCSSSIFFW